MLEAWPFQLEYNHKGVQRNISLHSNERLNVIVTPSAFRSVGDARSFVLLLSQVLSYCNVDASLHTFAYCQPGRRVLNCLSFSAG